MSHWLLALGAGALFGIALGTAVFILAIELSDGRTEICW